MKFIWFENSFRNLLMEILCNDLNEKLNLNSDTNKKFVETLKTKYLYEKEKREYIEKKLNTTEKELEKLKEKFEVVKTELQQIKISQINSITAKMGYMEEDMICKDLNENKDLQSLLSVEYYTYIRINGCHKIDIKSENDIIKAQVKKYKQNQFQQLDRHWVEDIIQNIPELKSIEHILKALCEYPLLPNGIYIDKSRSIIRICSSNYSKDTLENMINVLNKYKMKIMSYLFLGTHKNLQPEYLICVEYKNNKRNKIVFLKLNDIFTYLETLSFTISKAKTVIKLGNDGVVSLQRKGGDNGKKSSNQLQAKIIISKLLNNVKFVEYVL